MTEALHNIAPPGSIEAKDLEHLLHPATNLKLHHEKGPTVHQRAKGAYMWDNKGNRYIEGMAGLWCSAVTEAVAVAAAERSTLPEMLTDLSSRARGVEGAPKLAPGRSPSVPLHVVVVPEGGGYDPFGGARTASKSRSAARSGAACNRCRIATPGSGRVRTVHGLRRGNRAGPSRRGRGNRPLHRLRGARGTPLTASRGEPIHRMSGCVSAGSSSSRTSWSSPSSAASKSRQRSLQPVDHP